MTFLGVDLAWRDGRPSGVVALRGRRFPLRLAAAPMRLGSHAEVLAWIAGHARRGRVAVGIDAPLLGVRVRGGRRGADDAVSRAFGRFHASTHSPNHVPALRALTRRLVAAYGMGAFAPDAAPRRGRPAIREVYPHALQVRLFALERRPGLRILPYKRRRFPDLSAWAHRGLGPFIRRARAALTGALVAADQGWRSFCRERPDPAGGGPALKALEDRWDAVLCALAVALERLDPGSMRLYTGAPGAPGGAILAPVLGRARPHAPGGAGTPRRPIRSPRAGAGA